MGAIISASKGIIMGGTVVFIFQPHVPLADAEMTLHLAMFAVEGLVGRVRVRFDAAYEINAVARVIAVDGSSLVGRMIALVFAGLLEREFDEGAFRIGRIDDICVSVRAEEVAA